MITGDRMNVAKILIEHLGDELHPVQATLLGHFGDVYDTWAITQEVQAENTMAIEFINDIRVLTFTFFGMTIRVMPQESKPREGSVVINVGGGPKQWYTDLDIEYKMMKNETVRRSLAIHVAGRLMPGVHPDFQQTVGQMVIVSAHAQPEAAANVLRKASEGL